MATHRLSAVVAAVGLAAGLAACGDGGGTSTDTSVPTAAPTTTVPEPSSTTAGPTTTTTLPGEPVTPFGPPATETIESPGFPGGSPAALLDSVRLAAHDRFDRFVLEFRRGVVPGFRVGYVDGPITEDPSGRPVTVAGRAFLQVTVSPAAGVDLTGAEAVRTYTGPERLATPHPQAVQEAVQTGDFEAVLTWVLGVDGRLPFAVATLTNPPRVVVDVRHPG